jgi:hypothetical protein
VSAADDWASYSTALDDPDADPAEIEAGVAPRGAHVPWSNLVEVYSSITAQRDWIAIGAIEGPAIVSFAGPEKKNKSWSAMDLCVSAVDGGKWMGEFKLTVHGSPIYLDAEYQKYEFVRRTARIIRGKGKDPSPILGAIRHYDSSDIVLSPKETRLKNFAADVARDPPPVIVLDPLRNHLDGDENDAKVIIEAIRQLVRIRGAVPCPIVVLHHVNKGGNPAGSRAISTRCDLILEGSDKEVPIYSVKGRKLRAKLDPIAKPFSIDVSHTNDDDDTKARTVVKWVPQDTPEALDAAILRELREPHTANWLEGKLKKNVERDIKPALTRLEAAGKIEPATVHLGGRDYSGWVASEIDEDDDHESA